MSKSAIEWTDETWNPVTGCTKRSPGCKNCYAERFAKRLKAMGNEKYKDGFAVKMHWDRIEEPLSWRKPRIVFVNSMGDLFHEEVSLSFIKACSETMNEKREHIFQILTKNALRLSQVHQHLNWSENIWLGVSIENEDYCWRKDHLLKTEAKTKFISFEPLLESVKNCSLHDVDWVIAGGESGPGARPLKKQWLIEIRNKCLEEQIPFFFKQWGGPTSKANGRELDGETWDQLPAMKMPT